MSTKFFFIAGEPSGDALGASLIAALKRSPREIEIDGIGGDLMASEGLDSLLPMDELCVIGLWEVLSQITRLNRLITAVVEEKNANLTLLLPSIYPILISE
jgi:lipid-A-disaccharide synthase